MPTKTNQSSRGFVEQAIDHHGFTRGAFFKLWKILFRRSGCLYRFIRILQHLHGRHHTHRNQHNENAKQNYDTCKPNAFVLQVTNPTRPQKRNATNDKKKRFACRG